MKSVLGLFLVLFAVATGAANIRDLDIGDGMYLQGILSDELVYVVRIDYSSNRVKVQRSKDGTTKWVSASDLISRETSVGNDVGRFAIGTVLFLCALDPDSCRSADTSSTNRYSSTSTTSTGYRFHVTNKCTKAVKFALHYAKPNGDWSTAGWWTISPNSGRYLKFTNGNFARSNNAISYYYAKSTDDALVWTGDDYAANFDGKRLNMKRWRDDDGDSQLSLTCT